MSGVATFIFELVSLNTNFAPFFPVTVFGEGAKLAGKLLPKGARVLVEGKLDIGRQGGRFRILAHAFIRV